MWPIVVGIVLLSAVWATVLVFLALQSGPGVSVERTYRDFKQLFE